MNIEKEEFAHNGFCLLKKNFYTKKDIDKIEGYFEKIINKDSKGKNIDKKVLGGNSLAVKNFIDKNYELKIYLNRIFVNRQIINKIKNNIGKNFKISDIVYRRSYPGDAGLGLHQDAEGENTIIINLSNIENHNGKTCFLKASHKFSSMQDLINRSSISYRLNRVSKSFLDFIDCNKGSVLMFNNRVWHGRFPNLTNNCSSSLLIGVYKEGSTINYQNDKNSFYKIKNKLNVKLELDKRRNLLHKKVKKKSQSVFYIIPDKKLVFRKYNIRKKLFKTIIYIFLIRFIYFFNKMKK
jgi:non-heme Fe2+,alpha-ketoglutarate-dependent halogenase